MATKHRRRRRRILTAAAAAAAAALAATLLTGCSSDSTADCLWGTGTIAQSLKAIHEAGLDAANDPTRTDASIAIIDTNLVRIGDQADHGKVGTAVHDLNKAIADYNKAILNGDSHPDSSRITDAANELNNACWR